MRRRKYFVHHYSPLHDQRFNRDFIMNTPNKDNTAQDTSDVDVAPASASPKQENDDDNESEKEMTTTMTPENKEVQKKSKEVDLEEEIKEERDQCSICLEDLPKWAGEFARMTCCGNGLHIHCTADLMSTKMRHNCILCRAPQHQLHMRSRSNIFVHG